MLTFKPEPWYRHRKPQEASLSRAMSLARFPEGHTRPSYKGGAPPSQQLEPFIAHEDG